jgi:hypothetical protein
MTRTRLDRLCLASAAAAVVWGGFAVVLASDGMSLTDFLYYFYGGLFFGLFTVILAAVLLVTGLKRRDKLARMLPLSLVVQFAFLALVFVCVSYGLAFDGRFAISRGALESAAAQVRSGRVLQTPVSLGLFRVSRVETAGPSVRFVVGEAGMADRFGVVYCPKGKPPQVGEDSYDHMQGPWWVWNESW